MRREIAVAAQRHALDHITLYGSVRASYAMPGDMIRLVWWNIIFWESGKQACSPNLHSSLSLSLFLSLSLSLSPVAISAQARTQRLAAMAGAAEADLEAEAEEEAEEITYHGIVYYQYMSYY